MTSQSPSFDDFELFSKEVYQLALSHAAMHDRPIGMVLGGLIYHAAIEALFDIPEELLLQIILAAGVTFRGNDVVVFQGATAQ